MKTIILNDTAETGHAGCILTMQTYKEQCEKAGIEIVKTVSIYERDLEYHYKDFEKVDLLIVNGEGSMHDNKRPELVQIAGKFPSVLINTVWQNNAELPELDEFLYVAARESYSSTLLNADLVPDIVFASDYVRTFREHHKVEVQYPQQLFDTAAQKGKGIGIHCSPESYITALLESGWVITGRFHGVVLCAMLGIPFVAYESNTHKIEGLMNDMWVSDSYFETVQEALAMEPDELRDTVTLYARRAPGEIEEMFSYIAQLK
jgi:hypothetical protein